MDAEVVMHSKKEKRGQASFKQPVCRERNHVQCESGMAELEPRTLRMPGPFGILRIPNPMDVGVLVSGNSSDLTSVIAV